MTNLLSMENNNKKTEHSIGSATVTTCYEEFFVNVN